MSQEFLFGRRCENCKEQGFFCTQPGLLNFIYTTVGPGQTEVWIDGQNDITEIPKLRYSIPISSCEILTGKKTQAEVIKSMRKQIKHLSTHISPKDIKFPNW